MDTVFKNAQWIWNDKSYTNNEYCEFSDTFFCREKTASINISVCGDYTLFVNGNYVASNQYGDFPHYKVYDTVSLDGFLMDRENTLCILVWYAGKSGMRYLTPYPGLIYEIFDTTGVITSSTPNVMSRKSKAYQSGHSRKISDQLGYTFSYDATKEDSWLQGAKDGFSPSFEIQEKAEFYPRPIKKQVNAGLKSAKLHSKQGNSYVFDLGEEIVGLFHICFTSDKEQTINVSYGEDLKDGHVRRKIHNRDFSFDYTAKKGENTYTNYMLRLACRYLEIECEHDIDIERIAIIPQFYPLEVAPYGFSNPLDAKIYDICVNTLKLCMMEHYVDCPWREQCMYAYDSRNQMLSGYYAFEGGNFDYAKANLRLMSKDKRCDNLLSICFPSAENLAIPSFSLYYLISVKEYMLYSGDTTLPLEVFDKLVSILEVFKNNTKDGLITAFSGENYWNFYDWSPYAVGADMKENRAEPDFMINCIFLLALRSFDEICKKLVRINSYTHLYKTISEKLKERFFNNDTKTFFISSKSEDATELANSFALLLGLFDKEDEEAICKKLISGELAQCSLSMKPFKYDALLLVDKEKYAPHVIEEIRATYKKIVDAGSTTVWETIDGASAFDNAGSLCHGWSSIPIYYYNTLGLLK